jgi:hypothetical protein
MKTTREEATNAYEAFMLVRNGYLATLNQADNLGAQNLVALCKVIEEAEMGMRRNDFSDGEEDL